MNRKCDDKDDMHGQCLYFTFISIACGVLVRGSVVQSEL